MSKRGKGEICTYCKRALEGVTSLSRVAATKDHVTPKSKGGRVTVWCCRQCNNIKKDMSADDWQAFMDSFPEWWKHPEFVNYGRKHKQQTFYAKDHPKVWAYSDSMYILRYGKKAWREKKERERLRSEAEMKRINETWAKAARSAGVA